MMEMPERPKLALTFNVESFVCALRNIICFALAFFSKLTFQRETVILMYHSLSSTNDPHAVDPKEFRRQIEYLRKNYAIVSLDEIVDFIKEKGNLPRKAVAISFDDGYHDFYLNAYPYFRRNKLPATIFVTTGYVGKEWPRGIHHKMLTWKEIEEMSRSHIEIGAHSVTHPNLREMDLKKAENEIQGSKKEIEKHVKKSVKYFSYPFGSNTPKIVDIVKSSGFKGGLGGGGTIQKDMRVFVLKRVQVDRSVSFMLFKAQLTKAVDWLEKFEKMTKRIFEKSTVSRSLFLLAVASDKNDQPIKIRS